LLGDIGATNVRFALLSNGVLGPIKWFTVADFPRFTDAVNAFLDSYCRQVSVCEALLAVAGPVDNDRCMLTSSAWTIDTSELCGAFSLPLTEAAYRSGQRRGSEICLSQGQ
jgi:glucokinase